MSEIILRDICKSYENGFQAVKNFNLEIEKGELVVFVGPSGCGKSTTLRMIAGLEDISDGELWIGDKLVNYLEPKERDLATKTEESFRRSASASSHRKCHHP